MLQSQGTLTNNEYYLFFFQIIYQYDKQKCVSKLVIEIFSY